MVPVSTGVAGYRFDAQDETQLSIYPGDKVSILQKVGAVGCVTLACVTNRSLTYPSRMMMAGGSWR